MIVDAHFHIFPPMKGASGHRSVKEHMPNVERYCTYRQSREYMKYCSFIPPHHMELIWGENLVRLFAEGTCLA